MLTKLGPLSAAAAFVLIAGGCSEIGPAAATGPGTKYSGSRQALDGAPSGQLLEPARARSLEAQFQDIGFDLDAVRKDGSTVPRVYLIGLPPDIGEVDDLDARKRLFLRCVLPTVLAVNESIAADRRFVAAARARKEGGDALRIAERRRLDALFDSYHVAEGDFDALLERVDIVPPALALAQAAIESGWGRSRFAQQGRALFAQQGRALFGQHGSAENGIAARDVEDGSVHVRRFRTLRHSVAAYMRNLNTHRAYAGFRERRSAMRRAGRTPDGHALSETLRAYSERGDAYIEELQVIIDANALSPLDTAKLADGGTMVAEGDGRMAVADNDRSGDES